MKREVVWFLIVVAVVLIFLSFTDVWHPSSILHLTYNQNIIRYPLPKAMSVYSVINSLKAKVGTKPPPVKTEPPPPVERGPPPAAPGAFSPPSDQLPDRETFKKNWKGDCSYPTYISEKVQKQPWFPRYLYHLQRVNLSACTKGRRPKNCARWWYATPQLTYDEVPHRQIGWKPDPPPATFVLPKCADFGQELVKPSRCSKLHEALWRHLDKIGVLYFPRSGTELGVLRGSSYLTTDGDLDIFVDMPQAKLIKELVKVLKPLPYTDGNLRDIKTETHWRVRGCPAVHMVFNDWMADETSADFGRPNQNSTCECMMNSIKMTCHKKARYRMYLQYGPSWRAPLHAKCLDMPRRARNYNIVGKLKRMASEDGIVYEEAVRALDREVKYGPEEMEMILAQLNVLKELIAYQLKTKNYDFV